MDIHAEEINGEVVHATCPHCGAGQTFEIELGRTKICNVCQDDFEVEVRVVITEVRTIKPIGRGI